MNATAQRTGGTVAFCLALWIGAAPDAAATSSLSVMMVPTLVGQTKAGSLSRKEVDQLLNRARQAIKSGNLDQAEVLLGEAVSAEVRYPLWHLGATPSTVRRELNRAKRTAGIPTLPTSGAKRKPTRAPQPQRTDAPLPADPFLAREARLPAPLPTEPLSPSYPQTSSHPNPQMPPTAESLPQVPGLGRPAANPFASDDQPTADSLQLPAMLDVDAVAGDQQPSAALAEMTPPDAPLPGEGSEPALNSASPPLATSDNDDRYQATPAPSPNAGKRQALDLIRQARQSLDAGDLAEAEKLARQASALNISESQYLPGEDRPSLLAWDIQRARTAAGQSASQVALAVAELPPTPATPEIRALHVPEDDATQNQPAASLTSPLALPRLAQLPGDAQDQAAPLAPTGPSAKDLLAEGEQALRDHDRGRAFELFRQAHELRQQLDEPTRRRLASHLQMLSLADPEDKPAASDGLFDNVDSSQRVLAQQLSAEVGRRQSEVRRIRTEDPKKALELLSTTRKTVADSKLAEEYRTQLLRRLDLTIDETEQYIADHRAEIELEEQNQAVFDEVERRREVKIKIQGDIAELVDEFNRMRDEQRYEEMEIIAQRLYELAPDEPVAQQVWENAKFIRRNIMNQDLANRKEMAYWDTFNDVDEASIPLVGDDNPLIFDQKRWEQLVKDRRGSSDRSGRMTERELEIQRRLNTPVLLRYEDRPLAEVIDGLSQLTGVNIHLDARGLSQEGVASDTRVTINLNKEISLKSALNLILEELHLSYVIKDEVLKITSQQLRDGEIYPKIYQVADLVIPIPNFVPSNNIGLQGLLNDAHASLGYGMGGIGAPGPITLVNGRNQQRTQGPTEINDQALAQQFSGPNSAVPPSTMPIGGGPGGLGGGANADFDSLIDLIISTVATETWAENGGGEAEVRPFPTNLSLVISQTQAVHEEIADLLEQLRRLQDLQVTIEVRFIRLSDSFFERIGVDFDVNIEDRTAGTEDLTPGANFEPRRPSAIVGIDAPTGVDDFPRFTSSLDIPFRQNSFGITVPNIGPVTSASDFASFGFAILSDIEAYFLINAAQGDTRTNILNAPKVTLFNGQQAFVADAIQMPFVISVIPVVGEFAAAQQPVIVVLSEGTLMSIQAVVSDDRRYVRLTVVPFFSDIGDVDTFTFEGSTSSTDSSSTEDDNDDGNNNVNNTTSSNISTGTTVQLPTFQFVAVVTTVSVPDGGTVLLGGIKRLSEGRDEYGVPLLSKVPYINRLFRNVGIGRDTDSLMMMVTPRIIIQEEEEERLGIAAGP